MNFKYYLSSYVKKDRTQLIRLKLETSKNDVQYIDSNISIKQNQWNHDKQLIKRHPLEEHLNAQLQSLLLKVKKLYYKSPGVSANRLKQIYKNIDLYNTSSFLDFYQSLIDEMTLKDKIRTAKTNQNYLNKLKQYSSKILFSDLSTQFSKDYERWMIEKGNKVNTIASNFKSIKAVLNKAVKLGIIEVNPLRHFSIKTENTEKETLTIGEIEKIIALDIPDRFKGMIKARDMFLFSFYTAGMRFGDMCKLQWKNITKNEIVYTMSKSKDRAGSKRTIPLNEKSKAIIEKYKGNDAIYVFPPLYGFKKATTKEIEYRIFIANNALNRSLKKVGREIECSKNISIHIAKHSFADYAVKNKMNMLMISKLLGHTKLSTTQNYLKDFYKEEESEALNDLFNGAT